MKASRFSVIIPTHNRAAFIPRALNALVDQTFKDFEVIVADDGSTDDTKAVVSGFFDQLRLRYVRLDPPSGGAARPRNRAVQSSSGEWLSFLDYDDWWHPKKLESLLPSLAAGDVVYHDLESFSSDGRRLGPLRARSVEAPAFRDLMVRHNGLVTSGVSMRRSVFDRAGGFAEVDMEDYDLWLRVGQITDRFVHIPRCLGGYLSHEGSTTQTSLGEVRRVQMIFDRHVAALSVDARPDALAALRYIQGRILLKMGDSPAAVGHFVQALRSRIFIVKFKAFISLLLACAACVRGRI
jgi:glycosyltransferase involved in cell wall biosynthesis